MRIRQRSNFERFQQIQNSSTFFTYPSSNSNLRSTQSAPRVYTHRNNQLNKCALPNSLKGPKIILDMADRHASKDGPYRILRNAITYLLSDFFGITFLHFLSQRCERMIKFAFEQICFMKFTFDECTFFLPSSHP